MLCFSMSQYMLAFMILSINCSSPGPAALTQPQTMTLPPPCLTVGKRHWSLLTQCISVWYGNSLNQDCKALQRVVRLAERISGSALPSLQDIYLKRCKSRAAKIIKDSNHPGNHLFCLLPSGKRFRSMMAKTERLRRSFFPQAIRLLNTNSVS